MDFDAFMFTLALFAVPALIAFAAWAVARLPFFALSWVAAPCAWCSKARTWPLRKLGWMFGLRSIATPQRGDSRLLYLWHVICYCVVYSGALFLLWVVVVFALTFPKPTFIDWWRSGLPYVGIGLGSLLCLTTYAYWRRDANVRADRSKQSASPLSSPHVGAEGYNPEIAFVLGLAVYLAFALLVLNTRADSEYWDYVRYILATVAGSLPFGESIKELAGEAGFDLKNVPSLGAGIDFAFSYAFQVIWGGFFLLVTLAVAYTAAQTYSGEQRRTFEFLLLRAIRAGARPDGKTVKDTAHYAGVAVQSGDGYAFAALRAADGIIARCCSDSCTDGHEPAPSNFALLKAVFASYLVAAWKCIAVERSALFVRLLRVVTREINGVSPYWPAIKAHRAAISEPMSEDNIKALVDYMRRAINEWETSRAPLHWASVNEALGALLSELAADESETLYLEEAVEAYTQSVEIWRQNKNFFGEGDLSAAIHNLAVAELLLGRRRCKPAFVGKALEHLGEAISLRKPPPLGQITPGASLLPPKLSPMDLGASYAMRGQAFATNAAWYGDDRDFERAVLDYAAAIEQYKEAANGSDLALFNLGAVNMYAGNLALQSGTPGAAVHHFKHAQQALTQSALQAARPKEIAAPKYHAALRVALASLQAAAAALSRLNQPAFGSCTDAPSELREKARNHVERANKTLLEMAKKRKDVKAIIPYMHWVKGAAWIAEAELCFSAALPAGSGSSQASCRAIEGAKRCERGAHALLPSKKATDDTKPWIDRQLIAMDPKNEKLVEDRENRKLTDLFPDKMLDCDQCIAKSPDPNRPFERKA